MVPEVWNVLDKIKEFSEKIRSGSWVNSRCHLRTYLLTFSSTYVEFSALIDRLEPLANR